MLRSDVGIWIRIQRFRSEIKYDSCYQGKGKNYLKWSEGFAAAYDRFMFFIEKRYLASRRTRLLSGLSGRIFEGGVGTGVNFKYYKDQITLIGIEPSPYMLARAEKRRDITIFPDRILLHNLGCGSPEVEALIEPASLDVVVSTLVLCTIPDPVKALSNFHRMLKPGGRLIVLEHIRSHSRIGAAIQDAFNPVWEKAAEGCQLNRPTDRLIAEAGFRALREERFRLFVPFYEAECVKPTAHF